MNEQGTDRQLTADAAGSLRERLRKEGWRSDLGWAAIGARAAPSTDEEVRRTIAYLASIRAVDGGAAKIWKEGDVPAPAEADAREVFVTRADDTEWHSELLEAPVKTTGRESDADDDTDAPAEARSVA